MSESEVVRKKPRESTQPRTSQSDGGGNPMESVKPPKLAGLGSQPPLDEGFIKYGTPERSNPNDPIPKPVEDKNQKQKSSPSPLDPLTQPKAPNLATVDEHDSNDEAPNEDQDIDDDPNSPDAEGQDSDTETTEEEDADEDVNPYEYLGQQLRSDGFIDSDFQIDKTIKGHDLYKAYTDKLKKEIEPRIKDQVFAELQEQGINEQDLIMARLIRQGEDVALLQNQLARYERFAAYDKDADEDTKANNIKQMYAVRGYSEDEAETLVKSAIDNDRIDEVYGQSSNFFADKYKEFVITRNNQNETARRAAVEQAESHDNLIQSKLASGEIYGEKIDKTVAKELYSAIYTPEVIEIEGQKQNMTKFQKFTYDFYNDPELRVFLYKKLAYRQNDLAGIKKEVKKEVEDDFISAYKKSVTKNTKPNKARVVRDKLTATAAVPNKNGGTSYFIEV